MMLYRILVVDDDSTLRSIICDFLQTQEFTTLSAASADEGLDLLDRNNVDAVISDESMPGMSGSEFLAVVRQKYPETVRIVLTGHASLETAIRAINEGEIYRFFTKPCSVVDLAITVRRALEQRELLRQSRKLLEITKRQSALIESLEKKYPGITRIKTGASGEIIIYEDAGSESFAAILKEIRAVLKKHRS
jgi:DNA-binding NtrC family response regulator